MIGSFLKIVVIPQSVFGKQYDESPSKKQESNEPFRPSLCIYVMCGTEFAKINHYY